MSAIDGLRHNLIREARMPTSLAELIVAYSISDFHHFLYDHVSFDTDMKFICMGFLRRYILSLQRHETSGLWVSIIMEYGKFGPATKPANPRDELDWCCGEADPIWIPSLSCKINAVTYRTIHDSTSCPAAWIREMMDNLGDYNAKEAVIGFTNRLLPAVKLSLLGLSTFPKVHLPPPEFPFDLG